MKKDEMITNCWIMGEEDLSPVRNIRKAAGWREEAANDRFAVHVVMKVGDAPAAAGKIVSGESGHFYLEDLVVHPAFRGQRVGDLMARLLLWRTAQFADAIFVCAPEETAGFFLRYGFQKQGGNQYRVLKEEMVFPSACGGHHGAEG